MFLNNALTFLFTVLNVIAWSYMNMTYICDSYRTIMIEMAQAVLRGPL